MLNYIETYFYKNNVCCTNKLNEKKNCLFLKFFKK